MKKAIKVIDLLNMIANKEKLPEKIIYHTLSGDKEFEFRDYCRCEYGYEMSCLCDYVSLNDEVEIIEEDEKPKEIDKIAINENGTIFQMENGLQEIWIAFAYKINELAKAVNYLLQKEDE